MVIKVKGRKLERFYFIRPAGDKLRFRNILRKQGKELEPMIQMEVKIDGEWLEVIRCDRAHDYLHIDLYDRDRNHSQRELASKDTASAIAEVIDLLKRDWSSLFEELRYEEIISYFVSNEEAIKSELDNARDYLLKEAKGPDSIEDYRGKGVVAISGYAAIRK